MSERNFLAGLLVLLLPVSAGAEVLSDPMRPPNRKIPVVQAAENKAGFLLSAIVYSPDRRIAVVNGKPVAEGEKVNGATVRRIERGKVELEYQGKSVKLRLSTLRKSK